MEISKNGFYDISENNNKKIVIKDNINVILFDLKDLDRQIILGKNSRLEFYGYLTSSHLCNKEFIANDENSRIKVGYLLLASKEDEIKSKISGIVKSNNVKINLKIISLASNNSFIDVDGILKIEANLKNIEGSLEENNIFLGESGKINSIPTLLVGSRDVSVSHSCNIEKINDEELFYLRSKGIEKNDSTQMILDSYIRNLFKCIKMINENFYENLISNIKKKI